MIIQSPPQPAQRRAYCTAQYQVSKKEMASLYKRYYVWVDAKNKALKPEWTSFTNMDPHVTVSHHAYQTASYAYAPDTRHIRF